MAPFIVAVFLSAFLLFQIQPIIARFILPEYGGGASVWTACMMFFQTALLVGYAYAHIVATRIKSRYQLPLHAILLALSLLSLPVGLSNGWVPPSTGSPAVDILLLLTLIVGAPFALISASAPLLQHWFANAHKGRSPYRLYALSNLGSLTALVSYPTLVEPQLALGRQSIIWSSGYVVLIPLLLVCCFRARQSQLPSSTPKTFSDTSHYLPKATRILWVALACCGSTMLLAMTHQVSQNIAVIPFLWIAPLSLYLITFIITFESDTHYRRHIMLAALAIALALQIQMLFDASSGTLLAIGYQLGLSLFTLFASCMICHGELARSRASTQHLTTFYLYVALGGALGGVFVNLMAPLLFSGYWELHIALVATVVLAGICILREQPATTSKKNRIAGISIWSLLTVALSIVLIFQIRSSRESSIDARRNFYGVLSVDEWHPDEPDHLRELFHGNVQHGLQCMTPSLQDVGTSYYGKESGGGLALTGHPKRLNSDPSERGLHIGIVGLGIGTLSAYGTPEDHIRYYEINPDIEILARKYFTNLANGKAATKVIIGDARVSLQRELNQTGTHQFDVLVLDAFSGDAIPVHLLTEEAFRLYMQHLHPQGILAIHITNKYLDLIPVALSASNRLALKAAWIESGNQSWFEASNDWLLISRNDLFFRTNQLDDRILTFDEGPNSAPIWTDDFSNLFDLIKWD